MPRTDARSFHPWNLTPKEAIALQNELRVQVRIEPLHKKVHLIAGADISFDLHSPIVYAGFIVLDGRSLMPVAKSFAIAEVHFPYIPGLLSFREIPPLIEAWKNLKVEPDVIVVDGQGIAHPRRLGIASHLGLALDRPTIGCGKTRLSGDYHEPANEAGAYSPLVDRRELIGVALRTKKNTKPVFISPGHRMDFDSAIRVIAQCTRRHRIPEPTRQAHLWVNELRKAAKRAG